MESSINPKEGSRKSKRRSGRKSSKRPPRSKSTSSGGVATASAADGSGGAGGRVVGKSTLNRSISSGPHIEWKRGMPLGRTSTAAGTPNSTWDNNNNRSPKSGRRGTTSASTTTTMMRSVSSSDSAVRRNAKHDDDDDDGRVGAIFEFSHSSTGGGPQITWTRGMSGTTTATTTGGGAPSTTTTNTTNSPYLERSTTSLSTSVLPTFTPSSTLGMADSSRYSTSNMHDNSSSSGSNSQNRSGMGHSFVSRQSIISESDGSVDHMLDDDFILGVASSSTPQYDASDGDNNNDANKSIWKSRMHQEGVVDQQVNLMDAETGRYEKKTDTRGRGGLTFRQKSLVDIFLADDTSTRGGGRGGNNKGLGGFRQKSLVDIFLQDDSSSSEQLRTSLRASRLQRTMDYGFAGGGESERDRRRAIERCMMYIFLFLLLIGGIILALPQRFGKTNAPTSGPVPTPNPSSLSDEVSTTEELSTKDNDQEELVVESRQDTNSPNSAEALGIERVRPLKQQADEMMDNLDVSVIPNDSRINAMQFLAIDFDISKVESFQDMNSAPSKALKWISLEDPANLPIPGMDPVNPEDLSRVGRDLLQRYAMAVFYFSQQQQQLVEGSSKGEEEEEEGTRRRLGLKATPEELKKRQQFDRLWTSEDPICDWSGVECGDDDSNNHLVTAINVSHTLLGGTLPREILLGSALPSLTTLDISYNRLEGSLPHLYESNPVTRRSSRSSPPPSSKSPLESLWLQHNLLEGNIDPIVTVKRLINLDLSNNEFTGRIPAQFGSKLLRLESVHLAMNHLHGKLPSQLSALTELTHLDLGGNVFTGTIPSALARMQDMKHLSLQKTKLDGSIPSFLGNLKQLKELYLHNTDLKGKMPDSVCSLVSGSGLQVLTSDCNDYAAKVTCDCCTDCFWE